MSQFFLVKKIPANIDLGRLAIRRVDSQDDFFNLVAEKYFTNSITAFELTNITELIDEVHNSIQNSDSIDNTEIVRFLSDLMRARISFVIWCSDDYDTLPQIRSVEELKSELKKQATNQPADTYLAYVAV